MSGTNNVAASSTNSLNANNSNDISSQNQQTKPQQQTVTRKASMPASMMDFVSADVNEVLQDARDVLTNRERREEHPNERVLDESTTVRVTKTGGDEDPMEVTVLRRRLVKRQEEAADTTTAKERGQQEDRGWSSDTDAVPVAQRARMPSIHKCSHQRTHSSIDDIVNGGVNAQETQQTSERHMNVVYRRRNKDDLWRRDDLVAEAGDEKKPTTKTAEEVSAKTAESMEEEEEEEFGGKTREEEEEGGDEQDEAKLKVEITEQCHTEEGGDHMVQQSWEATWTVHNFHMLPDWMQDNDFLHTGHRPPLPSFAACFRSILSLHTETGNIWTHLLGCLAFFFLALWFLTRPETHIQFQEKLVFSFFFAGAILCLGLSFTFHTVSCHSKFVVRIFSRLDYMGISLLIVGSFIPWIYYGFYCRREPKVTYIAMISIFGLAAIVVSLWDKFNDKRYRPLRAGIFSFMGLSGVVPAIHFVITDGMRRLIDENSFYWLLAMALLYLFGALLYATRTPERFFPGKCDLVFQSHQLFHLCVVCAAFAHYYGISQMAMNRLTGTCPGVPPIQHPASSPAASFLMHNEL